jgi:hypothetical protein
MKQSFLILVILITFISCKKDSHVNPPEQRVLHRAHGQLLTNRAEVSKNIGPEGGTISADDGALTIQIPPGALATAKKIGIQAITSSLEGGQGPSYRLTPEDITFSKPVTISISYSSLNLEGSNPELLRLAYQDKNGYYFFPGQSQNSIQNKEITVQTTHFSDWTLFECYKIIGPSSVVPSGIAKLTLMTYLPLAPLGGKGDQMLGEYVEAGDDDPILSSAVWKLNGEGEITPLPKGCDYLAPPEVPNVNPVTISVSLTGKFFGSTSPSQKLVLIKPIAIEGGESFFISVDGQTLRVIQPAFTVQSGKLYLSGKVNQGQVHIWVNANRAGKFPFNKPGKADAADLNYIPGDNPLSYLSSFRTGCNESDPPFIYSPGEVHIQKYPLQPGEFLQGVVSGAIVYTGGNYCAAPASHTINASFKIMRR